MEEAVFYIRKDSTKIWYLPSKGKDYWHRLDGPAVEDADGTKEWYVEDKRHRFDGPAIEWHNGSKSWYVDNKRHRLDGPAIEYEDGTKSWYVDGKELLTEDVETWLEENEIDLKTDIGKMAFKLVWL